MKRLAREPQAIAGAEGKDVKVISSLFWTLPADRYYNVLLLQRPVEEVVASQAAMLQRLGAAPPALPGLALSAALTAHLKQVEAWMSKQAHLRVCLFSYHSLLRDPQRAALNMRAFLRLDLDAAAMAAQVTPELCRQRRGG